MKSQMRFCFGSLLCLLLMGSISASAQVKYSIQNLGSLIENGGSTPLGLNNRGEVVGYTDYPDPYFGTYAFRTAPNTPINPATDDLGGFVQGPRAENFAFRINDVGQVVGRSTIQAGIFYSSQAFRLNPGQKIGDPGTNLGGIGSYYDASGGYAINNLGQVTGEAGLYGPGYGHAFRTTPNGMITPESDLGTLGTLEANSAGQGINLHGQVAGWSELWSSGPVHAFLTSPTGKITDPGADLGTFREGDTWAYDVNDQAQVVGEYYLDSQVNGAFLWEKGVYQDIGTLDGFSHATAINNRSQVVGYSNIHNSQGYFFHPFLWQDGKMTDLNDLLPANSDWLELATANDINDLGQIVGVGIYKDGKGYPFLMTPLPAAVPEPGWFLWGLAGGSVCLWYRHRQRRLH